MPIGVRPPPTTPKVMTGFMKTLTPEQQKEALEYRGEDTHGFTVPKMNRTDLTREITKLFDK